MYGPVTYYGTQTPYRGYPVVPREPDYGFVSYYTNAYNPIFMTSINYPGIYGSHTIGIATREYRSSPRMSYYPPAEGYALRDPLPLTPSRPPADSAPLTDQASLTVRVPSNAELWFQGERMTKTGTIRDFVTPLLLANREYTYDIRAIWRNADGVEVTRTRQIPVHAGDKLDVDLLAPEPPPRSTQLPVAPTLRTMPSTETRNKIRQ
jgi:uncharacterized protein (TIGR03000 family)